MEGLMIKLEQLINDNYASLNQTDLYILKVVMSKKTGLGNIGIEELAKECNTSRTSILRMTKKLGFHGYSEFKNILQWQKKEDTTTNMLDTFKLLESDMIQTSNFLNQNNQISQITAHLRKAKRVFIYGTGQAQRYCAQELQRLFMQIDSYFYNMSASAEFKLAVKNLTPDDLIIIISLSGDARNIEPELRLLNTKEVPIVSITNFENNKLAGLSTYRLYAINTGIELKNEVEHHSFVPFFLIIEYLFRDYLTSIINTAQNLNVQKDE